MKKACSYAKKYKGLRKPTCGCVACAQIWEQWGQWKRVKPVSKW